MLNWFPVNKKRENQFKICVFFSFFPFFPLFPEGGKLKNEEKKTFKTDFYLFKKEEICLKNEESLFKPILIYSQKEKSV